MKLKDIQWTIDTTFQVAEQLQQATFLINTDYDISKYNQLAYQTLNTLNESFFLEQLKQALKKNTADEWDHFWTTGTNCLRVEEIFQNPMPLSCILVKVSKQFAIGFLIVDSQKTRQLQAEYNYLLELDNQRRNFSEIVSENEAYLKVLQQVLKVADTNTNVLIQGETGTGKELLAKAIHNLSHRKEHPLFKVNCAALTAQSLEYELFGYEKDAFRGAFSQKLGLFELASPSTLLLDEIGELPLEIQSKLLNVLQEGKFYCIGGSVPINTDTRIISTTSKDLEEMVQEGSFRKDLYYRITSFPIRNIPLRERKNDIPLLVNHFRKKYAKKAGKKISKVSERAMRQLMIYDFPGNIRELENLVERAVILSTTNRLNLDLALPKLNQIIDENGISSSFLTFEEMQKKHILDALKRTNWRVSGSHSAATLLGLNPKTLTSKMRKLNIKREKLSEK